MVTDKLFQINKAPFFFYFTSNVLKRLNERSGSTTWELEAKCNFKLSII